MSIMKKFCILLLLISVSIFPQEFETDIEGEASEELIELIDELKENPIDINAATIDELLLIPYIDNKIADDIIRAREKRGGFINKESLKDILPAVVYSRIEPYIRIETAPILRVRTVHPEFRVRVRIERKRPEDENTPGNPLKAYMRTLIDYGRFRGCFLTEKDAGEKDITDFLAFGIEVKSIGILENLIVGYYGLDFGERLILGSPVLTFKGSPYSTRRKGTYLYTITGENTYERGIACRTKNFGAACLSLFYSYATLDARGSDSIYYTYSAEHTTLGWEERKDRARETIYGGHLDVSGEFGTIGWTYYHASDYNENEVRSYSPFSVNFCVNKNRLTFFGEVAYSRHIATVCGFNIKGDKFVLDVIYRYLPTTFFSPHSSPFSDRRISSYGVLNDRGVYTSIVYKPFPKTEIILYGDHMEWEDDPLPGKGNEYRVIGKRQIRKELSVGISYKYKCKQEDYVRFVRIDLDLKPVKEIGLRLRTEWARENDILSGELVYGDIFIQPMKTLSLHYRYIIFDSDLSRFRFTEYESGLPGVMGNRFITGHGKRNYIVIRYKPLKSIQFSLKYEETFRKSSKLSGQVDLLVR